MKDELRIADMIDAALDRWQRAARIVGNGKVVMQADRQDMHRRLMELDQLVTRHDFSGSPIIAAAIDRAHKGMMRAGEIV